MAGGFDWRQVPYFRILIFLVAGYQLSPYLGCSDAVLMGLALCLVMAQWFLMRTSLRTNYGLRWLPGFLFYSAILLLSVIHQRQYQQKNQPTPLKKMVEARLILVEISSYAASKNDQYRFQGELLKAFNDSLEWEVQGGLLLYLEKSDTAAALTPGNQIVIPAARLRPPFESRNPFAFSYRSHLAKRHIHFQAKLNTETWNLHERRASKSVNAQALRLRNYAVTQLYRYLKGPQQAPFAAALLLGDRSGLDPDLVKAYAASGAIHVLAVSGLHVGILYMLLNWVFKSLLRLRRWRALFATLVFLWLYALVTGLPPSVSRACTMFSLIAIARELKRDALVYNTIATAAFVLLWLRPGLLHETGFQLSFAAVLGIIYIQPKIYALLYFKYKPASWLWELSSVSMAAQLFTFPLSIYYFNQFPNYFLLSNFIVIPAAAPLLLASMLLLLVSPLPWLAEKLGWLLGKGFDLINQLILGIEALPGSLSSGLVWSTAEIFICYLLLLTCSWWLWGQAKLWRSLSIWLAVLLLIFPLMRKRAHRQQQQLLVYDEFRKGSGSIISGRTAWYWGNAPDSPYAAVGTHFSRIGLAQHMRWPDSLPLQLWEWHGLRILQLRSSTGFKDLPAADVLLVSHQPKAWRLRPHLSKFKAILLDSSNSPYYCVQLKKWCAELGIDCYSTAEQGALVITPWSTNTYKPPSISASDTSSLTGPTSGMLSITPWSPS